MSHLLKSYNRYSFSTRNVVVAIISSSIFLSMSYRFHWSISRLPFGSQDLKRILLSYFHYSYVLVE